MRSATTADLPWRCASVCTEVIAVDISEDAVARIAANAAQNGITNVHARAMNVFDELRELERRGERFDTIVLDPPAFAKNKAAVAKALSGYKEINLRALKLLQPGGFLVTCSCSYNVSESMFADVLAAAAVDAHAEVVVVEKRMQGRDHPVLMTVPETYYLKCFVLRKLTEVSGSGVRDQGFGWPIGGHSRFPGPQIPVYLAYSCRSRGRREADTGPRPSGAHDGAGTI